jgi:prophage regulatory protein
MNQSNNIPLPIEGFAKLPAVMSATGLSRSTIYARVKTLEFPAPLKLGARAVAWDVQAIRQWIDERRSANHVLTATSHENAVLPKKRERADENTGTQAVRAEHTGHSARIATGNGNGNTGKRAGTDKEGV